MLAVFSSFVGSCSVCEQVVLVGAILVGLLAAGNMSVFGLSGGCWRPRLGLVLGGRGDVVWLVAMLGWRGAVPVFQLRPVGLLRWWGAFRGLWAV